MRSSALRFAGTLAVCVLAVSFTGCSSNNKGKIEGKWKITTTLSNDPDVVQMKAMGLAMAWEFKPDGTYVMGVVADKDDPDVKKIADSTNVELKKKNMGGKYSLGMGDQVTLSGGSVTGMNGSVLITVTGDNMSLKGADGTVQFVRIK